MSSSSRARSNISRVPPRVPRRSSGRTRAPWGAVACVAALVAFGGLAALAVRPDLGAAARTEAIASAGTVGFCAIILLACNLFRFYREGRIWSRLAGALTADRRARLILDARGRELFRNEEGERLFGPADDPAFPLMRRAGNDERAAEEIGRLAASAKRGVQDHAEIALPEDGGADLGGADGWMAVSVHPLEGGGVMWLAEDVSARRAIEDTLRRDHEMLTDFIDFLPVGFYSADTEGRFRFVNQRFSEWLGIPVEQLIGKPLLEILGTVPNPEEERAEMRLSGRNGDVFLAFVSHSVFDAGGETLTRSVVVRDLIPERHWERVLRTAERRFRWLFDESPVGIVLADPDMSVSLCNAAFAALVGSAADAIAGRPVSELIHQDDRPVVAEQMSRLLMGSGQMASGQSARLPVRLVGRRGRDPAATLYISPIAEDDAAAGLMLHFIDTTGQKHLEIEFAQSQKMQAMGQLAGGVAHDFNNLLTAMIGFCDLLLQRHGPGDASFADIMQIKQNANRAASLVRQLLAFSRRQTLQPKLFDVTDALADLSTLLRRLLGETIELVITHGRDLGHVRVDPGQFDQVIINLAVNARDAMPKGGQLSITTRRVNLERPFHYGADTMPPGDYVQVEVTDTGTGIDAETLGRIFEPFFSTKEVGQGTGLGLSTVYGIVRQTDGYIFVDSQVGEGTSFHIFLARFDPAQAEARNRAAAAAGEPAMEEALPPLTGDSVNEALLGADLTGVGTVMIVEDEDAVRLFGARALRNKGYKVIEARSGENALELLRNEDSIDVLVTDVVMPGMDGATLARTVREQRPGVRVILMSGYAEDVALGDFTAEEGVHFLPKPFSLKQLAGKVKEAMTPR